MDPVTSGSTTPYGRLAPWAMGLFAVAIGLLQHPFFGVVHDSLLYTLFSLVKLHPDTLASDIVVRFGSQDRFTLFSPLYTAAIQLLGVEHAAALLLFVSQVTLLIGLWLLARRFMSRLDAALGIAFVVALPSDYGSRGVFHFMEDFMTPRMPAEALVIGAIVAASRQRYWIAGGCTVAAMLLHPIMGAAGAAFLVLTWVIPLRPKLTLSAATVSVAVVLGVVLAIAPLGRLSDPEWMRAIETEVDYLFVSSWSLEDWSRASVPLAVLVIGWRVGVTPMLRKVCAGALGMAASGIAITLLFADLLHVWLFISLQAWRWLWLADVLALVLAPAIIQDCWQRGDSGRVALIMLAVAWVFRGLVDDFLATAVALALAVAPPGWGRRRYWRLALMGACVLLAMGIGLTLIDRFTYDALGYLKRDLLFQEVHAACSDGILPVALSILAWMALRRETALPALVPTLVAAALSVWLVPHAWRNYTAVHYTPALAGLFAPWRAQIPPQAEVLWPDTVLASWYLLDRPSYWSTQQVAGGLFSRQQALIMERRTAAIRTALKNSNLLLPERGSPRETQGAEAMPLPSNVSHMDLKAMTAMCADPDLQYVVMRTQLAPTPFPPVTDVPSKAYGKLYLYRCADLRP